MPEVTVILVFLSAAMVLFLMPGPVVLYTVARSISQGRGAGLVSVLAAAVGDFSHVMAATLGLSALLASSAVAYEIVRYAGAVYLIYLGIRTCVMREPHASATAVPSQPLGRIFGQGVIVAVLNPKTALFFLAFLPQFVRPERGGVAQQILVLGALFVLLGMLMNTLWALSASAVARRLSGQRALPRAGRYVAGAVYLVLGLAAALGGHGAKV